MSRAAAAGQTTMQMKECYICGRPVMFVERDHFPTPQSLDGKVMQDACRDCHDMKDRHPLEKWDPAFALQALSGLWAKANPQERIMLAKMFHITSQQAAMIKKWGSK